MSNPRTFIIPGDLSHLGRTAQYLNDDVCGILVHQHVSESEARRSGVCAPPLSQRIFTLFSLTQLDASVPSEFEWSSYDRCLRGVLADPRTHYIATRSALNSAFNNAILIEKIVVNSLRVIRATDPRRLVSSSTPHSLEAWIFAKCFEILGLPVFVLERTPINNRAWIYSGLDSQSVVPRAQAAGPMELTSYTRKQVSEQRDSKAGERDKNGFFVSRMDLSSVKGADSHNWWSLRRELGTLFEGRLIPSPARLVSTYLKRRLYRSYEKLETEALPAGPFVIFFMHYQPERSSLPEGLFHVQQWIALRQIAWALPPGWTLLVREHPTTWLQPLDISVRTASLYEDIATLPNTRICSMQVDTFELIDKCAVVATLTGSVGFQALLRNKPVIVFGLPAYKDHPGCFSVQTAEELAAAMKAVRQDDLGGRFSDEALEQYLLWVERHSLVADDRETDWLEARLKNFTRLYRELFEGGLSLA